MWEPGGLALPNCGTMLARTPHSPLEIIERLTYFLTLFNR